MPAGFGSVVRTAGVRLLRTLLAFGWVPADLVVIARLAVPGIERRCALTTVPSLREYCRTATDLDDGDLVLALA
jgi:hypothetical protein